MRSIVLTLAMQDQYVITNCRITLKMSELRFESTLKKFLIKNVFIKLIISLNHELTFFFQISDSVAESTIHQICSNRLTAGHLLGTSPPNPPQYVCYLQSKDSFETTGSFSGDSF